MSHYIDNATGVTVKNAFNIHDHERDKTFLLSCRTSLERERWLAAFQEERRKVETDRQNGFNLQEFKQKVTGLLCHSHQKARARSKGWLLSQFWKFRCRCLFDHGFTFIYTFIFTLGQKLKKSPITIPDLHSTSTIDHRSTHSSPSSHRTMHRGHTTSSLMGPHHKTSPAKRSWFPFKSRKSWRMNPVSCHWACGGYREVGLWYLSWRCEILKCSTVAPMMLELCCPLLLPDYTLPKMAAFFKHIWLGFKQYSLVAAWPIIVLSCLAHAPRLSRSI